ncbi:MAG: 4-alpha-glucanotransferase [Elusimicrobia bacterium]|nr:4-alpha-glucanotransferase [Elusimicrobiota bacterium]
MLKYRVSGMTLRRRASGVLAHISSLPGPHGIGDLGPQAYRFADFLAQSGQGWWQMLPVGPIGAGNSPYSSTSAFAGEALFISLEDLVSLGLLDGSDLDGESPSGGERADYAGARRFKEPRLRRACARFAKHADESLWSEFRSFYGAHEGWLDDYSLFCGLKETRPQAWTDWEAEIRSRRFKQWDRELLRSIGEASFYHHFVQFLFHKQWTALRDYCAGKGVGLIGDVPIFVAHDSADVWANQSLFVLGEDGRPASVAGVPPDYFSETGQLWGNPLYRWDVMEGRGFDWWLARLRMASERFDAVRFDHFIGFQRYWEIPAGAKDARQGQWRPGPGARFFDVVTRGSPLELIAEDLGAVTHEVLELRDRFDLPGMRVLQFAFGSDQQADSFLPHNYPRRCVAYTGAHDNDTVLGWFHDPGGPGSRSPEQVRIERDNALRYLRSDGREFHWDMIRAVMDSSADTAIIPLQDLLGLGSEARMNRPGSETGNWEWRLPPGALTPDLSQRLRRLSEKSGRLVEAKV